MVFLEEEHDDKKEYSDAEIADIVENKVIPWMINHLIPVLNELIEFDGMNVIITYRGVYPDLRLLFIVDGEEKFNIPTVKGWPGDNVTYDEIVFKSIREYGFDTSQFNYYLEGFIENLLSDLTFLNYFDGSANHNYFSKISNNGFIYLMDSFRMQSNNKTYLSFSATRKMLEEISLGNYRDFEVAVKLLEQIYKNIKSHVIDIDMNQVNSFFEALFKFTKSRKQYNQSTIYIDVSQQELSVEASWHKIKQKVWFGEDFCLDVRITD